ncbi:hypothetical protein A1Q2_07115 [Trichosporon asahii var. asahii CBS 8904]|uniref:Uncharacterized protein n=1 Tax=Trichosporon asahii var. asahii (strain CBS 8904) TaxID=1220162 RepID=K1V3J3_TRIAC|nr:hypothetical protein A1Q2_07115 [Trichosporon asahii var. asahii CBS 8904]
MSESKKSVEDTLSSAIAQLEEEAALKKTIKEATEPVEDIVRQATAELNRLHSANVSQHEAIANKALEIVAGAHTHWASIATLIPKGEFFRYQWALSPMFKSLGEDVGELQLVSDDYLQGVIGMVNELLEVLGAFKLRPLAPQRIIMSLFNTRDRLREKKIKFKDKADKLKVLAKNAIERAHDETLAAQVYKLAENPERHAPCAAELFLFWLYCHDQLTFHWFGDDLTAWPALVKDYEEVGSWERSKRDAWWAQYLMDRLRLLTDTSHPKIPASVISAWGLDAIHDAEAAVKEELGPTLRSRSPGSVACILRSGSEWEFDITKGWIPKHVKFDWFLSRVQEAIIRSYTTHQYAEFPEHEWLAPQSKDKKHLRVAPPRKFGPAGAQGQTLILKYAGEYVGGSNAEDLRNRWAKFIFRYEEPKGSVKPRFLPLSFTAAAMVLDHNFDDSVALELNASFRCCEVYLGVDSVPLSNTHQTNCEYCPTNFPPFKSETAVKVNGATVLFLACIVLHNPQYLDHETAEPRDVSVDSLTIGRSEVFIRWQSKSTVFPVHVLLNEGLKLATPTVENSRPTHIILTRIAIVMGCVLGAAVSLLDQIIRKQTQQAQKLKSLSAVSLEWAEILLSAAPISGGGNLQLSFGAMRQCVEDWLDAKLDDATQGLRTAIVHMNELLLRRIHYSIELLYPKAPIFRRRVVEAYLACLHRTFLLTLSDDQSCDFEVREFAVSMQHSDHSTAEWTVNRLVYWGLESQSDLNKAIGVTFFAEDHNYAAAVMAFLAAGLNLPTEDSMNTVQLSERVSLTADDDEESSPPAIEASEGNTPSVEIETVRSLWFSSFCAGTGLTLAVIILLVTTRIGGSQSDHRMPTLDPS